MSGFKEKTWKKWKEGKTTSPVTVTNEKTTDSISSQRSSSLIRSRKRHVPQDVADNILAADGQEIIPPRAPVENEEIERVTTNNKDHCDTDEKNDFRNKSTSPFNTLAPTNPFYRENVIIVQYGELKDNKSASDAHESNELWGELPSAEVVESPKPVREKGPKGGSKRPAASKQSNHKPYRAPPASPTKKKAPHPAVPQRTPTQAPPQTTSGPSGPYGPPPRSGQSQHPRTSPSSDPDNGTCDFPECPVRGPKQKERLCMAPECPVTLKKAVVKEAKRAMKRSCGKKRKNPLTILGAVLMSTFAGHDSSCKLTKEEKRALKRMKQTEETGDDDCNTTTVTKKSKGVQCKAPILQRSDRAHSGPEKANKSTICDIPECPVAARKTKIKEFLDKGQLCDIPSCPVKEPPPRKEKKVEPPKGCPFKPCTLKTKDEEFLKQLDPCIFEKLPRLKMTCEQALAEASSGQSRPHHTPTSIKNKENPSAAYKTKEKDKGVTIVAAHVQVPPCTENPFLETIPNPEEFPTSNKLIGRQSEKNQLNSDGASECQKIVDRRLSTAAFLSEAELNKSEITRSRSFILHQKDNISVIRTEDGIINRQVPKIRFLNVSVEQKDNSRLQSTPKESETIQFKSTKSVNMRSEKSLQNVIKLNHTVDENPQHLSQRKLITSKTLLPSENAFKSTHSNCLSALKDEAAEESATSINITAIAKSNEVEKPSEVFADDRLGIVNLERMEQDFPMNRSYSLISKSDFKTRKSDSFKFDFSLASEDNQPVVTDSVNLLPVVTVNYSSISDTMSHEIFEDTLGLPIPAETSTIKLHERNWKTPKYSATPLTELITYETMSGTKSVARVLHEPSKEIQYKKPVISLHVCRDTIKHSNHIIFDKNTLKSFRKDEQMGNNPSVEHDAFNQVKVSSAQSTQTLATSAISPNKFNTIGLGGNSIIDPGSEGLGS